MSNIEKKDTNERIYFSQPAAPPRGRRIQMNNTFAEKV
jgi:hypothetical protein